MSIHIECNECSDYLGEGDRVFCGKCAGRGSGKGPVAMPRLVDKVRWIGDELRDSNVDWRIVERVRELEAELLA